MMMKPRERSTGKLVCVGGCGSVHIICYLNQLEISRLCEDFRGKEPAIDTSGASVNGGQGSNDQLLTPRILKLKFANNSGLAVDD